MDTIFKVTANTSPETLAEWLDRFVADQQPQPVQLGESGGADYWISVFRPEISHNGELVYFTMDGLITRHWKAAEDDSGVLVPQSSSSPIGEVIRVELWGKDAGVWVVGKCSRREIDNYVKLMRDEILKAFSVAIGSNSGDISPHREHPRHDAAKRAALAVILLEQGKVPTYESAAKKARTTIGTIKKWEHSIEVQTEAEYIRKNPDYLIKLQQQSANKPKNRTSS